MYIAIVGAGAAGLATAHELLVAGHRVAVFEQSGAMGGLWNYTDEVEDDPLGQRPSRRIHGSLYASLRVNLPRDLGKVAEVFFSGRLFRNVPPLSDQAGRVKRCPPVASFDGPEVVLANGEGIRDVDVVLFCTGYGYRFAFLGAGLVSVGDNWVKNLYRQVVAVEHPTLAFIGLPFRIVPFPVFQRQARWFARSLAGDFPLPSAAERRRVHREEIARLRAAHVAERHFHRLGDKQIDYLNGLAGQCGDSPVPDWFVALWKAHNANARRDPADYRDRPLTVCGTTEIAGARPIAQRPKR